MRADSTTTATSEGVETFVTEIAEERANLGYDRSFAAIREIAGNLGLCRVAPKQIVIGGTNAKGSTLGYLQQILTQQGVRVGSTVSPHMHSYVERIMLDGEKVTAHQCFHAIRAVAAASEGVVLTYFDLTTLAALQLFKHWEVDVALIEVGLGGRLDCANIVDSDVAVITNIDIDHREILGNSIEKISREKVQIARKNKPLVFADRRSNSVVERFASEHESPLYRINREFGLANRRELFVTANDEPRVFSCPSSVIDVNECLSTALQVAALLQRVPNQVAFSTMRLSTPDGRFERVPSRDRQWILDVAHNPSAIRFLRRQLARQNITQCVVVFACFADKDVRGMLDSIEESVDEKVVEVVDVVLTDSQGVRGLKATAIADEAPERNRSPYIEPELDNALSTAVHLSRRDTPIVVLGSFDLVSRVRSTLNIDSTQICT